MKEGSWWWKIAAGVILLTCWMIYRARRRRNYSTIPMETALDHMKTGDLVLFSGRGVPAGPPEKMLRRIVFLTATYIYRALYASEWTHVAVVYRHPVTEKVYLIHAELESLSCTLAEVPVSGVQVTDAVRKIQDFNGYCVWRPINQAIPGEKVLEFLRLTYAMHYRMPCDIWIRFLDRLLKARRARGPTEPDYYRIADGAFCSEWVGAFYEFCGVFDKSRSPYKNYYLPSDFNFNGCNRHLSEPYRFDNDGWEIDGM
jgi:hypothetical protein